jgi:aerobic-type carbon monoxide dehydrogenase small subunit (CoxS/CutS family)
MGEVAMAEITLSVNGSERRVEADPTTPLVYVLRNQLGLTGVKNGCGLEQCGSCAVLVDGVSTLSCAAPAAGFEGREIVTIEGLAEDTAGRQVVQAFVDRRAAQCGYCTPGIVVAVSALLRRTPRPTRAEALAALRPHLCRCGAHARVLAAVGDLAREPADG